MNTESGMFAVEGVVRQAQIALCRCDSGVLEGLAADCEALLRDAGSALPSTIVDQQCTLVESIRSFGLFLLHARGTLNLLGGPQAARIGRLEYSSVGAPGE